MATLTVSRRGSANECPLDPSGVMIGRDPDCDVVLASGRVSRRHARIFLDPFGRWVVEDLGSHNGVSVNSERTEAAAVQPGDTITVGPFSLSLCEPQETQVIPMTGGSSASAVVADLPSWEIAQERTDLLQPLSQPRLHVVNKIIDHLTELGRSCELYPEVCRSLAGASGTAALVVRVPAAGQSLSASPPVLAYHCSGDDGDLADQPAARLHLSRRVLEAVRTTGNVVRASNAAAGDGEFSLTLGDTETPRTVLCAPLSDVTETLDVLYLDLPAESAAPDLSEFVRVVARQVDLTRKSLLLAEGRAERRLLDQQLSLAREIQRGLTPTSPDYGAGIDIAVCYQPALWVGGDYCDVWRLPDDRLAMAVGDVSGKGLPAAMVMSNLQAALRAAVSFCGGLSEAMTHVSEHLVRHLPTGMFVTMVLATFNQTDGTLEYVNAGHILPLMLRGPGDVRALGKPSNPPLGLEGVSFQSDAETIGPDTGMLVVSDGITEAMSPEGEQLGGERLTELLQAREFSSADDLVRSVVGLETGFRQSRPQHDDVTVFALFNRPAAP